MYDLPENKKAVRHMCNERKNIKGIIFDKDGTLFDFHKSWANWVIRIIKILSDVHGKKQEDLADALGFNMKKKCFYRHSHFIAGTLEETAAKLVEVIPNETKFNLQKFLVTEATNQPQFPVAGLKETLTKLKNKSLRLGVVTNDAESAAVLHLKSANIYNYFDFVIGYDSGYGSKPDTGQIVKFCQEMKIEPHEVLMVGDSSYDLIAGQKAGVIPIGVLTGIATANELRPLTPHLLESIVAIPNWLDTKPTSNVEN